MDRPCSYSFRHLLVLGLGLGARKTQSSTRSSTTPIPSSKPFFLPVCDVQSLKTSQWLLPRAQRRYPPTQPFTFYQHQQNPYEMHPYPAPPPGRTLPFSISVNGTNVVAYRNNYGPPPPRYEPPQGASKMNPNQQTLPPGPPQAGEASNAGPESAAPEHQQAPAERFHAVPLQGNEPPPRPQSSGRSWNPLKRFK